MILRPKRSITTSFNLYNGLLKDKMMVKDLVYNLIKSHGLTMFLAKAPYYSFYDYKPLLTTDPPQLVCASLDRL